MNKPAYRQAGTQRTQKDWPKRQENTESSLERNKRKKRLAQMNFANPVYSFYFIMNSYKAFTVLRMTVW